MSTYDRYGDSVRLRAAVLRASAYACTAKWSECDAVIQSALSSSAAAGSPSAAGHGGRNGLTLSPSQDLSEDYLHLFLVQTLIARRQYTEAYQHLLESVPSIRLTPAVISATFHLMTLSGEGPRALDVLWETVQLILSPSGPDLLTEEERKTILKRSAAVFDQNDRMSEAAEVLQHLVSSGILGAEERLEVLAQLVVLLSYTDPAAAERFASSLPQVV